MLRRKYVLLCIAGVICLCGSSIEAFGGCISSEVHEHHGHYYICYGISIGSLMPHKITSFNDGGQFEVLIRKDRFPISAPRCHGNIILRMPWTDPALAGATAKVEQKRKLYDQIISLSSGTEQSVEVMVDLAPYVREIGRHPVKLELTGCNVFFEQNDGSYVPAAAPTK